MFNVRRAGDHLYRRSLVTWLSLFMSLMVSYFVLSFFSHEIYWMRSGTELDQFPRLFLSSLRCGVCLFIVLLVRYKIKKRVKINI